jgi:hypothetical protein
MAVRRDRDTGQPVFTHTEADHQITDAGAALVINSGTDALDGGRPSLSVEDLRRTPRCHIPARAGRSAGVTAAGSTGTPGAGVGRAMKPRKRGRQVSGCGPARMQSGAPAGKCDLVLQRHVRALSCSA